MRLDHEFTVPVPAEKAWPVLLDIERIAPCLPGAAITKVEGNDFEGEVKVKLGPIAVSYSGQAAFTEIDEAGKRAVITARGRETRGGGTANATITAQLAGNGESTTVTVRTDLSITGRPAQFGRGVISDVSAKLLGQFADCLAEQLAGTAAGEPAGSAPALAPTTAPELTTPPTTAPEPAVRPAAVASQPSRPAPDSAIDLLDAAGLPVLKRLVPALGGLALLALIIAALRRRST